MSVSEEIIASDSATASISATPTPTTRPATFCEGKIKTYINVAWSELEYAEDTSASPSGQLTHLELLNGNVLSATDEAQQFHQSVQFYEDVTVIGKTKVNSLGVVGDIIAGKLTINGTDGDGSAINTLAGPLRLQPTSLGNVEIMGDKFIIDTKGNLKTVGEITTKKINIDIADGQATSIGEGIIKSGETQTIITTTAVTEKSFIFVSPKSKLTVPLSVTNQSPGASFTVEISSAQSSEIKFNWWIIN
jgi:hypothetical protein